MNPPTGTLLVPGGYRCTHCGAFAAAPTVPVLFSSFLRELRAFQDAHATCSTQPAIPAKPLPPMPVPVAPPAFQPGDKVLFPHKNREKPGTVHKLSEPHGIDLLIKYHGGHFIWRRAAYVKPAPLPEPALPSK